MNLRPSITATVILLLLLLSPFGIRVGSAAEETIQVGAKKKMAAHLILPEGQGPFPAVLVLHTSSGLRPKDLDYAKRLAGEGYVCLVPAFMEAYGITNETRQATFTTHGDEIFADLVDAVELLKKRPEVAQEKIGVVGFSNGGYWAMLLAARAKIRAGVSYYGAFTAAGADRSLKRFQQVFTKESSPVLILHGSRDTTVYADSVQRLFSILDEKKSPYDGKIYSGAGHSYDRAGDGIDAKADAVATADSWTRTLAFFREHLSKP
jgi:carboxymethylenebutenolidase